MKQISDEVFAQVRDAICVAESLTERSSHHPKILAALAALDTAQPVHVNVGYGELEAIMGAEFESHGFGAPESNKREYGRFRVGFASGWHSALTAAKQAQPEPVNQVLIKALSAMLTHSGMDEDEWSKPTFDQARAAIMLATTKTQECGMCGYVGTKTDAVGQCPRCHWGELQAQPERAPSDFDVRGFLASRLKCWHRLTEIEADELVALVKLQSEKPLSDQQIHERYKLIRGDSAPRYIEIYRDAERAHGIKQGGQQ